jgi:hypothetical protein
MKPHDDTVTLTIDLARATLFRTGGAFPEHLLGEIREALADDDRSGDMHRQLMRLFAAGPITDVDAIRMNMGSLLYAADEGKIVVWGVETFAVPPDFTVVPTVPIAIVHDRACWVERHDVTGNQRVNWAGEEGKLFPPESVVSQLCAGLRGPCYAVNFRHGEGTVGFVVEGKKEHRAFASVENLTIDIGKPSYAGRNEDGSVTMVVPS